jgi:hypothetical protein
MGFWIYIFFAGVFLRQAPERLKAGQSRGGGEEVSNFDEEGRGQDVCRGP